VCARGKARKGAGGADARGAQYIGAHLIDPAMAHLPRPPMQMIPSIEEENAAASRVKSPGVKTAATTRKRRAAAEAAGEDSPRRQGGGLTKEMILSDAMANVLGVPVASRTKVVQGLWAYGVLFLVLGGGLCGVRVRSRTFLVWWAKQQQSSCTTCNTRRTRRSGCWTTRSRASSGTSRGSRGLGCVGGVFVLAAGKCTDGAGWLTGWLAGWLTG
jgi:hypothetical protein